MGADDDDIDGICVVVFGRKTMMTPGPVPSVRGEGEKEGAWVGPMLARGSGGGKGRREVEGVRRLGWWRPIVGGGEEAVARAREEEGRRIEPVIIFSILFPFSFSQK